MPDGAVPVEPELCERCFADVSGAACCVKCAPVYEVYAGGGSLFATRNLRRAWEVMTFYQQQGYYFEASVYVPEQVDLDHDGLSDRESELLQEWSLYEGGKLVRFHLCLPREAA